MKHTRRFMAMLLALVLTLGLCVTAFADEEDSGTTTTERGTITVDNAVIGKTYTIYRIFDLNDHDTTYEALNYKVNSDWAAFFADGAKGRDYVKIDEMDYVTWNEGASVADFAEKAIAFAKTNNVPKVAEKTAENGTVTFTDLSLGYYLMMSDLGALCSLDTTKPNVTIHEKNGDSTIEKKVIEDDGNDTKKECNDAEVGQTVSFKTTVTVVDGQPKGYIIHDEMTSGLAFDKDSLVVMKGETKLDTDDYTLVYEDLNDSCTFHVVFKDETDTDGNVTSHALKPNDVITLTYSATVTKDAIVETNPNTNKTQLEYGEKHKTEWSTTRTYTLSLKGYKFTETSNGTQKELQGAEFLLYKKNANNENVYAVLENGVLKEWKADKAQATTITSDENGEFKVSGLDSDTYYLEETKAPAGYNQLKDPVEVKINGEYGDADNTKANVTYIVNKAENATDKVSIENQTGATLPSTGGIGTTIFYALGSVLALGAVILLVTKKRMAAE